MPNGVPGIRATTYDLVQLLNWDKYFGFLVFFSLHPIGSGSKMASDYSPEELQHMMDVFSQKIEV